ncbi:MAG: glycosyltransferase [Desulfovibrio sp.]|jgi:GT2 family glycosyltransferase|nr:glycosyltransferase [Desulfovibrio sp.]
MHSGYPEEALFVSARNRRACARFADALAAFSRGNFALAARCVKAYRDLVRPDDFYRHEGRGADVPLLSLIVVAYGTTTDLLECLASVHAGTFRKMEVIVIDNGGNAPVLPKLTALPLLYVKTPMNLLPAEGRNIGVSLARAPIGVFLDDDALAAPNFLQSALEVFGEPAVMAARGRILPKNDAACQSADPHYDPGEKPLPYLINIEGNSAWRLEAYRLLGGMDPLLFGHEGYDLSLRLVRLYGESSSIYRPSMLVRHDFALTPEKKAAKTARYALMSRYLKWKNKG